VSDIYEDKVLQHSVLSLVVPTILLYHLYRLGMTISELVNRLAGLKKTLAKRLNIRSAVLIDPDNELNTRSRHVDQQSPPL
jgi:hypothetical protein